MPRAEPTAALAGHPSDSGYERGKGNSRGIWKVVEGTHPLRIERPWNSFRTTQGSASQRGPSSQSELETRKSLRGVEEHASDSCQESRSSSLCKYSRAWPRVESSDSSKRWSCDCVQSGPSCGHRTDGREENNLKWRPHHLAQETSTGSAPWGHSAPTPPPPHHHHHQHFLFLFPVSRRPSLAFTSPENSLVSS